MRNRKIIFITFFVLLVSSQGFISAQTLSYNQLTNEVQFVRSVADRWAVEVYLGGTFSSTPTQSSVLKTNIQRYGMAWGHYFLSPRWKLSSSLAYYYNKDVPDIGQYFSPEWRISLQGIYYIHKRGYSLYTRMRGEIRFMMNKEGVYEDKYRYRQMIKYVQPLNGKVLRKGVVYLMASEELLFKPNAKSEGITFFDRNRFEIGGGYLFTDDIQVELSYANEFMPRDDQNEMYNILQLTLTINNLFLHLKDLAFPVKSDVADE